MEAKQELLLQHPKFPRFEFKKIFMISLFLGAMEFSINLILIKQDNAFIIMDQWKKCK